MDQAEGKELPLAGTLILDLSRMLPGAVLARQLIDLGARVIKIERPQEGDPMRHAAPVVDDIGLGFRAFLRGAESVCVDISKPPGAATVRRIAARADVLMESFRPGTLAAWGLASEELRQHNPRLITCSLPARASTYAFSKDTTSAVGHDLNLVAESGLLDEIGAWNEREPHVPGVQIADVTAGLLAASSVLAALLSRSRSGIGCTIEQPLATGPLPFLSWARSEGGQADSLLRELLGGSSPAYRCYRCADGKFVALAAVEPKFWTTFVRSIGATELLHLDLSEPSSRQRAANRLTAAFAEEPSSRWLELAQREQLPISPVRRRNEVARDSHEPQSWLPSVSQPSSAPAPRLGEHTSAVLEEFSTS